jgi:hypothetical protein
MGVWEKDKVNHLSVKIHNSLGETYNFEASYRLPGMTSYLPMNVTFIESDIDFYTTEYSFSIAGSYLIKITEIDGKLDPLIKKLSVLSCNEGVSTIITDSEVPKVTIMV